jgi:predicted PhzF superfamily epimerase YddE/YHI9
LFLQIQKEVPGPLVCPDEEIELCGHGAAATGIYLGTKENTNPVTLNYLNGAIKVALNGGFEMELKTIPQKKSIEAPSAIVEGLGIPILEMWETENKHLILTENEERLKNMQPDFDRLRESGIFGYTITAPGDKVDFVSRTLVPHVQQLEDHATGSSHAILVPFWSKKLGKMKMVSHQLSSRGGLFLSSLDQDLVTLGGEYVIEEASSKISIFSLTWIWRFHKCRNWAVVE